MTSRPEDIKLAKPAINRPAGGSRQSPLCIT